MANKHLQEFMIKANQSKQDLFFVIFGATFFEIQRKIWRLFEVYSVFESAFFTTGYRATFIFEGF